MNATWDGTMVNDKYNCICPAGSVSNSAGTSCQASSQYQTPTQNNQQSMSSQIDGYFNGWNGESVYKLINGQYWQQSSLSLQLYLLLNPKVLIYSSNGSYKMHVDGTSGQDADVVQISVMESRIDGEFKGWEGETIYPLTNGQIWQQNRYHYHYHYAYNPIVWIYRSGGGYKMHVVGDTDQDVSVIRIQ